VIGEAYPQNCKSGTGSGIIRGICEGLIEVTEDNEVSGWFKQTLNQAHE